MSAVTSVRATVMLILLVTFVLLILGILIFAIIFIVKKRRKNGEYQNQKENITPRQEEIRKTLGETLKELRTERNMTQEFVAEKLGLSRQAVSKWENGSSEPSTTNLIAIAYLYGIRTEELLKKLR